LVFVRFYSCPCLDNWERKLYPYRGFPRYTSFNRKPLTENATSLISFPSKFFFRKANVRESSLQALKPKKKGQDGKAVFSTDYNGVLGAQRHSGSTEYTNGTLYMVLLKVPNSCKKPPDSLQILPVPVGHLITKSDIKSRNLFFYAFLNSQQQHYFSCNVFSQVSLLPRRPPSSTAYGKVWFRMTDPQRLF